MVKRRLENKLQNIILDGRYCHALCKEGYFPPAGYETTAKMTKITCKCNEEEDSCEWEADKPFIGCVGPCEKPVRSFENIELFFKASFTAFLSRILKSIILKLSKGQG